MKEWKSQTQYTTAVVAAISGIVLAFFQYFQTGDISNGVLGYIGEMLTFAAGIFGVTMYIDDKYRELKTYIDTNSENIDDLKQANRRE